MASGPATPAYVLRGHNSPVHSLLFFQQNAFLASGDADGWLIVWSTASKRPVAVWKAHHGGVTGIKARQGDQLLTHGRDHKLRVWKLNGVATGPGAGSGADLSTSTPADGATDNQPKPWLLHAMDMSALNFCSFAICACATSPGQDELLIASPNALDSGGVDIFHLPSEKRVIQLHAEKNRNTGMVMSLAMFSSSLSDEPEAYRLCLISGYEDGHVMVHYYNTLNWHKAMDFKAHSQPVLSLDLSPTWDSFFTSSADAMVTKCMLPLADKSVRGREADGGSSTFKTFKTSNTKHAGQQDLSVRSDGRIFATAGWDARARVYSCKTLKELAVLKWHKHGCSSTAFATLVNQRDTQQAQCQVVDMRSALAPPTSTALEKIKCERSLKAQRTHWLAIGGKDAKISLWDIY